MGAFKATNALAAIIALLEVIDVLDTVAEAIVVGLFDTPPQSTDDE